MKNFKTHLILLFASYLFLAACNKNSDSTVNTNPILTLSKTSVKIGEPLFVTTSGKVSTTGISWSVPSNGQVWPSGSTDSATFLFTSAGTYKITAYFLNNSGGMGMSDDSSYANVIVTDSVYGDTSTVHCDAIVVKTLSAGDQINLTPISYSDTGLIFVAHTQDLYNYSPILDCGGNIPSSGGAFECDFNSTFEYVCWGSPTPAPAVGIVSFTSLTNGTYDLVFKLNGTTYQGSITATDTDCTITWNYTSGVTVSPLTIQKQ